jgi:hypothetical protein
MYNVVDMECWKTWAWVRDERDIGEALGSEYTYLLAGKEGRSYNFFCDVRGY